MRTAALGLAVAAFIGRVALIKVAAVSDPTLSQPPNTESESRQTNFYRPQFYYPHNPPITDELSAPQRLASILDAIAANDVLQCVPKILCEMAAGSTRTQAKPASNIVDLGSVLALFSSVDDSTASPLLKFGRAFIRGYTARHIGSCQYAYPNCPSDANRLIHYLNNQNGGFFQYFNNPNGIPTNPNLFKDSKDTSRWRFPFEINNHSFKSGKSLKFPSQYETKTPEDLLAFPGSPDESFESQENNIFVFRDYR